MTAPGAQAGGDLAFGPFRLAIGKRLLTKDGAALPLSGRAFDLLVALVSAPNQAIDKQDLMAQLWPDVTVGEGSLRFHMASLRKALGDGQDGARYIATLAGRGYSFVAPISLAGATGDEQKPVVANPAPTTLPSRLHRMVGRTEDVPVLSTHLTVARFVTITGIGGVGKTTVAIAVGHALIEAFAGAVLFVDFGALTDPNLVAPALAATLGLSVRSDDATPGVIAYLRDRRLLLILDNCEHVIEAAATLAERIFLIAPQVHILATSREALRVEGEHVYKLEPLACAPDEPGLTTAAAMAFPATQLFMERATARGARLQLMDTDAPIVADICRKLDGVALAIELAAGRVEAFGLQETAALLGQRLALLWAGQRTAPPRQKTLQATLDWSYSLLSALERMVLRRLAVFSGYFTMHAALAVATRESVDQSLIFDAIDSLVAKSLVAPHPLGAMMRYRLLDTTRAYALAISVDETERAELAARHANYYLQWLEEARADWPTLSNPAERQPYLSALHNVRAALEWCFGANGDARIGVALAATAAHVFLALSLPSECHRWSELGIQKLDEISRGGREEMLLQAALGMSLMFTRGMSEAAHAALLKSLAIAQARNDALNQIRLLAPLHMFHLRMGDYKTSLLYAERSGAVSATMAHPKTIKISHSLLGITHHLIGRLGRARRELEAAIEHEPGFQQINAIYLGFDHRLWASTALARTLWLQGHAIQAADRAHRTIAEAEALGHPVTISIVVNWCISVFFWCGDLASAEAQIDRFISHVEYHSLLPYFAVGRGRRGELAIRKGDLESGVESLRRCLAEFHATHYALLTTEFSLSLIQGLIALGKCAEASVAVDETMRTIEQNGEFSYMPELLRMKARLLLSMPGSNRSDAEIVLGQSLALSRDQGAAAWELRSAVDLAAMLADRGHVARAKALLQPVWERCMEGLATPDLMAAETLLTRLAGK